MKSNQWFVFKRNLSSTRLHFVTGGTLEEVIEYACSVYDEPIVLKLIWWMMYDLLGVIIPEGTESTDDYTGPLDLPPMHGYSIVIDAL